jgi:O-antigen/teichoic acid export membrane protein
LIGARITDIAAQAFQAMEQLAYTANFSLLPYLLRMISAAILFGVWHRASAMTWGWFYLGSTVVSCAIAVAVTNKKLGAPKLQLGRILPELKEGLYFSTGLSAQTIYNDIDKTMLASLSTLDATGIYAAAYRVIDVAFTPVRSVLNAANAKFFRSGESGIAASYSYARRLLPQMIAYSVVALAGLYIAAPLFPLIIGKEFARTIEALRWLALLPLFKTIHYFFADSLTGAGYQRLRAAAQVFIAILNVGLNFWLIPLYSWRGAAWSSLACDASLAIAMYAMLLYVMAKEARVSTELSAGRV